jgi:hypothetical protein
MAYIFAKVKKLTNYLQKTNRIITIKEQSITYFKIKKNE